VLAFGVGVDDIAVAEALALGVGVGVAVAGFLPSLRRKVSDYLFLPFFGILLI